MEPRYSSTEGSHKERRSWRSQRRTFSASCLLSVWYWRLAGSLRLSLYNSPVSRMLSSTTCSSTAGVGGSTAMSLSSCAKRKSNVCKVLKHHESQSQTWSGVCVCTYWILFYVWYSDSSLLHLPCFSFTCETEEKTVGSFSSERELKLLESAAIPDSCVD